MSPLALSRGESARILLTLWLVTFIGASQFLIIAPVLPRIVEQLHFDQALGGTLVSVYAVMVATFSLVAGPVSDHFGRVTVLRAGSGMMAIALMLHAAVWSYETMLAARAVAGMSSGILAGAAAAYIGDIYPYDQRGGAMGWVMSAMAFGQIIGIPAGTVLAAESGFATPFVVFGVVMIAASALTWVTLPQPPPEGEDEPFGLVPALRTYLDLMKHRDITAVNIASTLMMLSVGSFIVYLPTWLEEFRGATPGEVALMFGIGGTAQAMTSPVAGRISDRIGRKVMIVGGGLGTAAFFGATTFVPSFELFYGLFPLVMMLVSARMAPLNALMTTLTGSDHRGSLMSLNMAWSQAGFALGSAAAGWTYAMGFAANTALAAGGATLAAVVVAGFVPEPDQP